MKDHTDVKQLADWLLTNPETGASLTFSGPLDREFLGMSRVKMTDSNGSVWTLTAGLKEGYLTDDERLANILTAAAEARAELESPITAFSEPAGAGDVRIPDAKRDELISALLASLEKSDQRETDFYLVRSFIGDLGLAGACRFCGTTTNRRDCKGLNCCKDRQYAEAPQSTDGGAGDARGWKLAMRVLQSDLYGQLDDAERAECDALVRANPYIAAPSQPAAPAVDVAAEDAYVIKRLSGVLAQLAGIILGDEADMPAAYMLAKLPEAAQVLKLELDLYRSTAAASKPAASAASHCINCGLVGDPKCGCGKWRASDAQATTPAALTDEQIDSIWLYRANIHNGELIPQLRDFARALLATNPSDGASE